MNVPDDAVIPLVKLPSLPVTPPGKLCTSGKVFAVLVDAIPPIMFAGGTRTPPPKMPGVTLPAATLAAVPATLPISVPLKNGAVTPPALTTMPEEVVRLA